MKLIIVVTDIFLLKNSATPPRAAALRPAHYKTKLPIKKWQFFIFVMCPQLESDQHFKLRRPVFYPLNYESLVPGVGIGPTSLSRHDFKSCAYTSSAIRAIFTENSVCAGEDLNLHALRH